MTNEERATVAEAIERLDAIANGADRPTSETERVLLDDALSSLDAIMVRVVMGAEIDGPRVKAEDVARLRRLRVLVARWMESGAASDELRSLAKTCVSVLQA